MPDGKESSKSSGADIFHLLTETGEKEKQKRRRELLAPLGIEDYFSEGAITINKRTCRGVECKLCVKACPTSALYWKQGEVGMTTELCIYCGACVLSCIVDDCIKVERKRSGGKAERFSKPREFTALQNNINTKKRLERIEEVRGLLPKPGDRGQRKSGKKKETNG
jgi:Fe-S-cluster-containing hydrogenase component 2